jgi:hypothetical protein
MGDFTQNGCLSDPSDSLGLGFRQANTGAATDISELLGRSRAAASRENPMKTTDLQIAIAKLPSDFDY